MKRVLGIATWILIVVLPSCDPVPFDSEIFYYDEARGQCFNFAGEVGFNPVDIEWIRETKDCECVKLTKVEVLNLVGDTIAIPQRLGYYHIKGYNFRGAVLDSCYLYFNHIFEADLRGADLSTLQYGYAFVVGRKDEFTKAPTGGTVEIRGDSIYCMR